MGLFAYTKEFIVNTAMPARRTPFSNGPQNWTRRLFEGVSDAFVALASTDHEKGASQVGIEDTAGNYVSTDVEGALAEIGAALATGGTGPAIYGSFSDSSDQAFVAGGAFVVQYNTTEAANDVSVELDPITSRPTRITVVHAGVYALTLSPQILHTGGGTEVVTFWMRVDGVDVPRSASSLEMGNNNNRTLPYIEIVMPLTAGQYVEWVFTSTTGTNLSLEAFSPVLSPPASFSIPAIPSVIAGAKRIGD